MRLYKCLTVFFILVFLCVGCVNPARETHREAPAQTGKPAPAETEEPVVIKTETIKDDDEIPLYGEESCVDTEDLEDLEDLEDPADDPPEILIDYKKIKPNESGAVLVVMYHGVMDNPGPYDRKTSDFIRDLNALYDYGYRLISLHDLMDGHIEVEAGYSPVVLTFDDGKASSFSLVEKGGVLSPVPGTALYLIEEFAKERPDFGKAAAFFICGRIDPFYGAGTLAQRFLYLWENGFTLGNHSWSHPDFSRLGAAKLQEELARTERLFQTHSPDYKVRSLAYPGGAKPASKNLPLMHSGEYNGTEYHYEWAFRAAPNSSGANPFHVKFDPLNISRVRPTDDSTSEYYVSDLWHFLRLYEREPHFKFISDGDPHKVTVPVHMAHLINKEAIGERELVVYNPAD